MSSSGLRPRAAGPQTAASAGSTAAETKQQSAAASRDAAALAGSQQPREPTCLEVHVGSLQRTLRSPRDRSEQRQRSADCLPSNSPASSADVSAGSSGASAYNEKGALVSAALHARAADMCRQPEVYEQLFLMLRSSQGQLAAACMQHLPPHTYIGLRDATGHTLLHWAALCNERDVMLLLINAGTFFCCCCSVPPRRM